MPTGFSGLLSKAQDLADRFSLSASHYDETGNFPFANFDALYEADLLRLTQGIDTLSNNAANAKTPLPSTMDVDYVRVWK